jgi:hypothetical protein
MQKYACVAEGVRECDTAALGIRSGELPRKVGQRCLLDYNTETLVPVVTCADASKC